MLGPTTRHQHGRADGRLNARALRCISAPSSCARTPDRRRPLAPFPRVLLSGQPVVTLAVAVRRSPAARSPARRPRRASPDSGSSGAVRVLAGGVPVATMAGTSTCVADRARRCCRSPRRRGCSRRDRRRLPVSLRRPRADRDDRRRRPPARPDRAGAVHGAGRARDAAGLRQRPARPRLRARRARARRHDAAPRPGRAAAGARPPDRRRLASRSRRTRAR